MLDQLQLKFIKDNPIGTGLDAFRASFTSICESANVPSTPEALEQLGPENLRNLTLSCLVALQSHKTSDFLPSKTSRTLRSDLLRLISAAASNDFDFDRVKPLLKSALSDDPDSLIWRQAYIAVTEPTPPPRSTASSLQQTPWLRNTSSFPNSSERRKYIDGVLKEELGHMHVGLPQFWDTYFGSVTDLEKASEAFLEQCGRGPSPCYEAGWTKWPEDAKQDDVLDWFAAFCERLAAFAETWASSPSLQRRPLAKPNEPIDGSVGKRKMDIGFVSDPLAGKDTRCRWSQILVPGELKSNPSADKPSEAWLDLGRYAREVLAAQDILTSRRFVLGFTICGSLMRVWAFDRVGGIASEQFDINKDGFRFVFTILGFLWMNDEELGFDPTILAANRKQFIEIERNGSTERIIIDGLMQRARCIAGRATTCWKGHPEGHPETLLVIKDSWQYPERDEEGDLLREVTDKGVANVARYYYHETVQVRKMDDDVRDNVRRGLDITIATNYQPGRQTHPTHMATDMLRKGRSNISRKRPSSQTDSPLPPNKRSCSISPTEATSAVPNRIHRRIILQDYGKPIYKATSRSALLAALGGCIKGHEALHKAGILHRDISINNLMINEDSNNPSWPSFLIDLDLAIRVSRDGVSGAKGKTGTRAFMAIGALRGEQHSFMHDLESFFWVIFWICIHCNRPKEDVNVVERFEKWHSVDMEELADLKSGLVGNERHFLRRMTQYFAPYFQPLVPWVNRLRRQIFPMDKPWEREDPGLYSVMIGVLREGQEDPMVCEEKTAENS